MPKKNRDENKSREPLIIDEPHDTGEPRGGPGWMPSNPWKWAFFVAAAIVLLLLSTTVARCEAGGDGERPKTCPEIMSERGWHGPHAPVPCPGESAIIDAEPERDTHVDRIARLERLLDERDAQIKTLVHELAQRAPDYIPSPAPPAPAPARVNALGAGPAALFNFFNGREHEDLLGYGASYERVYARWILHAAGSYFGKQAVHEVDGVRYEKWWEPVPNFKRSSSHVWSIELFGKMRW